MPAGVAADRLSARALGGVAQILSDHAVADHAARAHAHLYPLRSADGGFARAFLGGLPWRDRQGAAEHPPRQVRHGSVRGGEPAGSDRHDKQDASKWVWPDDLPAVALEEFFMFVVVGRTAFRERLNEASRSGWRVEKQDAAG